MNNARDYIERIRSLIVSNQHQPINTEELLTIVATTKPD
jgi:hypothetical protein